jgi:hypothetical protein
LRWKRRSPLAVDRSDSLALESKIPLALEKKVPFDDEPVHLEK